MAHNVITVSPFERIEPMPNLIFLLASVIASIRSMLACDVSSNPYMHLAYLISCSSESFTIRSARFVFNTKPKNMSK